jgi:hypothetical protein
MRYDTYYGLYRAETPLQHGADEKMETTSLCRYNTYILKSGALVKIYTLSVSTWRHVVRENATLRLLHIVGLDFKELPEIVQIVLMSGGPRLEKGDVVPLAFIKEIRKWFPLIDMMGTTVPFCMIEGKLYPTEITVLTKIIADEEFLIEGNIINSFKIDKETLPDVVTEFQFNTKRDPRTAEVADIKDTQYGTVANMFDTQIVMKGARLGHQIVIRDYDNQLLTSCLSSALDEWAMNGAYIGGKKSQGCGKVSFNYVPEFPSPSIYENFINENKMKIKDFLMDKKIWEDKETILKKIKIND